MKRENDVRVEMPFSQKRDRNPVRPPATPAIQSGAVLIQGLQYSGLTQLLMRKLGHLSSPASVPDLLD